jgi:hypothetical protein
MDPLKKPPMTEKGEAAGKGILSFSKSNGALLN